MINSFEDFPLDPSLQRAVRAVGYETPTPIQSQAVCLFLKETIFWGTQTGTRKTAAFALPILQLLLKSGKIRAPKCARALVLCLLVNLQSSI